MQRRATLHLICGLPGAGKTTYAERLKNSRDAALMSLDHWLITSFGHYELPAVGYAEHARRVYAFRELIWGAAAELLRRDADVVLDDGFFFRSDRVEHIARARQLGARVAVHFIDTPVETMRTRLAARTRHRDESRFDIQPEALDACVAIFEPPSADEGAELIVVRDTDRG